MNKRIRRHKTQGTGPNLILTDGSNEVLRCDRAYTNTPYIPNLVKRSAEARMAGCYSTDSVSTRNSAWVRGEGAGQGP